ncbi:TPA: 50S ribosomal protein L13 [Candidatus Nomurabacteria bacterium]|nr:MAG: 50S ribosomal protein L13 [Parcubacteria bacterium RAAC4_OD1_1]HCY26508.1 50S ribosomal protein L13 [Candidatus Nomurabacteria bacterium]
MKTVYTINAEGKTLGRVASEAAKSLMGKKSVDYTPNKVLDVEVIIENASKTKMTETRMKETLHERYSGYPGGLKFATNDTIIKKHGWKKLYELAVYNMLPGNKLRPKMMKLLVIKD